MKHPFHCHILPLFTMGAGGLGFVLRVWLYAGIDEKGLLPTGHPAEIVSFLLTALTLGILFLATRELKPRRIRKNTLRIAGCVAYLLAGLSLILTALLKLSGGTTRMAWLATVASLAGGLILIYMAILKYCRKRLPYWAAAVLTVVLMLDTVTQCQVWGAIPQVQAYFFPLLASIFLILTAYEKTVFAAKRGSANKLAFFSQSALFLCCLSLNTSHWLLYFGMLFWAAAQLYPCILTKKEA